VSPKRVQLFRIGVSWLRRCFFGGRDRQQTLLDQEKKCNGIEIHLSEKESEEVDQLDREIRETDSIPHRAERLELKAGKGKTRPE